MVDPASVAMAATPASLSGICVLLAMIWLKQREQCTSIKKQHAMLNLIGRQLLRGRIYMRMNNSKLFNQVMCQEDDADDTKMMNMFMEDKDQIEV